MKISFQTLTLNHMKTYAKSPVISLEEMFVCEIDSIYYPGYASELASSDPIKLEWEFTEFTSQFSH